MLDGNGTIEWADAHLTETGVAQALVANRFWNHALQNESIPPPDVYYASPLERCLSTAKLTFSGLPTGPDRPFVPIVKEVSPS
jgi:broad specificity phosphatase PhoE